MAATNATASAATGTSPWANTRRKFFRNRVAVAGAITLLVLYAAACLAGFLSPFNWDESSPDSAGVAPMLLGAYELRQTDVPHADGRSRTGNARRRRCCSATALVLRIPI